MNHELNCRLQVLTLVDNGKQDVWSNGIAGRGDSCVSVTILPDSCRLVGKGFVEDK